MITLGYSLSSKLEQHLKEIDRLREQVLCVVLPGKSAQYLRWETMVDRLYAAISPARPVITKKTIIEILSRPRVRVPGSKEDEVLSYKSAFDHVASEWLVTSSPVTTDTLVSLARIIRAGTFRGKTDMDNLLDYLGRSPDHAVVTAGIGYLQMLRLEPVSSRIDWMAWLLAYLFLYKAGYNLNELIVLESLPQDRGKEWRHMVSEGKRHDNQTLWLEYFSACIRDEMRRVLQVVTAHYQDAIAGTPRFLWRLTDRQKEILLLMDQPGVRMTNKKVQKGWKISAITASRELSALASLGLVYPHGKGRSVCYTRI